MTTPMAKARPKTFPQNRADFLESIITGSQSQGFEDDDEKAHPHGELGKEVVEGDGESEVKSVEKQRWIHDDFPLIRGV